MLSSLYALPKGANAGVLQTQMSTDPSVVWVEDNVQISTGEGTGLKGGTLPALGGRILALQANTAVLRQISWNAAFCRDWQNATSVL